MVDNFGADAVQADATLLDNFGCCFNRPVMANSATSALAMPLAFLWLRALRAQRDA